MIIEDINAFFLFAIIVFLWDHCCSPSQTVFFFFFFFEWNSLSNCWWIEWRGHYILENLENGFGDKIMKRGPSDSIRSLNDLEFTQKNNNNNWNFCGFLLFKVASTTHPLTSVSWGRPQACIGGSIIKINESKCSENRKVGK